VLKHVARIELLREEAATVAAEDEAGNAELAALTAELAEVEAALKPLQETRSRVVQDIRAVQDDGRDRAARLREIPRQVADLMNQIQGNAPLVEPITYGIVTPEQIAAGEAMKAKKAAYTSPEHQAIKDRMAEAEERGKAARASGEALQVGMAPGDRIIRPYAQPQPDPASVGASVDGALVMMDTAAISAAANAVKAAKGGTA